MKSWKTTVSAIAGVVIYVLSQLEMSPDAVQSWGEVVGIVGGIVGVGWFSRDNDKSSEDVNAGTRSR